VHGAHLSLECWTAVPAGIAFVQCRAHVSLALGLGVLSVLLCPQKEAVLQEGSCVVFDCQTS